MRTKCSERRVYLSRSKTVYRDKDPSSSNIRFHRELILLYEPMVCRGHGLGPRTFEESRLNNLD